MTFFLGLFAVVAVLSSILLMFVILLQEPKGGGIASALGGSGMEAIGVHVGGVNRFTSWVAGIWIASCLLHAICQPVGADLQQGADATKTEGAKDAGDGSEESGGGSEAGGDKAGDGGGGEQKGK